MMRVVGLIIAVGGLLLSGCEKKPAGGPRQLTVYMYSEYIDPELPVQFEKLTGIKPRIVVYENSEEMLAKLQQGGGAGQYDVIVVSDVVVPALIKLGLVRPLDAGKIPNRVNVAPRFCDPPFDPGSKYSMPYQWGTVGLVYAKDKMPPGDVSWAVVFEPSKQIGPFILMDSMRDMLGVALKYQGKSMNSRKAEEVKAAGELILRAKRSPNSLGFEGGVGGKSRVAAGTAAAAVVYNGDAVKAAAENDKSGSAVKIAFTVPKEGGVIWTDVMMITAKAANSDGAHRFINFILDAKAGAQLSNFNRYATPNAASMPMIRPVDRENPAIYPPETTMQKLEYLNDLDQDTRIYDEVWTTIKAR